MSWLKLILGSKITRVGGGVGVSGVIVVSVFTIFDSVQATNKEYVNLKLAPIESKIEDLREQQLRGEVKILKAIEKISDQMYDHNKNHN